jgi:hypothetical protein
LNVNGKAPPGEPPDAIMILYARESLRPGNRTSLKVIAR